MLVRQSKNSFIRLNSGFGYITNQLTCWDRTYNDIGTDFLSTITREAKNIDQIIDNELLPKYYGVSREQLLTDYLNFLDSLESNLFVFRGATIDEIESKDIGFSYSRGNLKTLVEDYTQPTKENIQENTQEFNLEHHRKQPQLLNLHFELTSACNERCIHCYIPNAKKNAGKGMPEEKVKSLIEEFAEMGGLHVTLSGGEAFLHPSLLDIMEFCREKDMIITILSNLISLKDSQIERIKNANVSLIQTSLYSMIPSHHDMITTIPGSFQKTKNALEKLIEADIPLQISCPVMKANKDDYKDVMLYAKSLNVKAQTDYIMMARADLETDNLANRMSIPETEKLLRDLIKYNVDYSQYAIDHLSASKEEKEFDLERYKNQPLCGAATDSCCIAENGDVYPCSGWQGYTLGNVFNQSLKDIWNNSENAERLRKITQSDFPQCLECDARDYCSRCLVRSFNECNGDMFALPKHFCEVAFLNKKLVEEMYAQQSKKF